MDYTQFIDDYLAGLVHETVRAPLASGLQQHQTILEVAAVGVSHGLDDHPARPVDVAPGPIRTVVAHAEFGRRLIGQHPDQLGGTHQPCRADTDQGQAVRK